MATKELQPKNELSKEEKASLKAVALADKKSIEAVPEQLAETEKNEQIVDEIRESLNDGHDDDPVKRRELRRGKK